MTARRLRVGMYAYAGIAVLAGLTLDGKLRLMVWIALGAMALKSWAAFKSEQLGDPPPNT